MTDRRIFAGGRARALRNRLGLSQSAMALRVGLSISYLSQIESDDRPMTAAVLLAFARAFPNDWADISPEQDASLLARTLEAAQDPTIPGTAISSEALLKAVKRQPQLAERLVATHAAYRHSQDQLQILDDAVDRGGDGGKTLPWEDVRDWFHAQDNYLDDLDRAAERIARDQAVVGGSWVSRLERGHGATVRVTFTGDSSVLRRYDPETRTLDIDRALPAASQTFLVAHQLVRLEMADVIATAVEASQLESAESRKLLAVGLSNYAAGALLMPYGIFRDAARDLRHDVDALRHRFGVSFEQVCHRLSTLQRPGATGVPFFFYRVDMAGNITKRHSATRFQFARYGGACPLWIAHEAVAIPDRILVQLAEMPDGVRYVSMAKGLVKASDSYTRRSRRYAVALGCEVGHAESFVYADAVDLARPDRATPIGVSCRICPRPDCDQRAFPPAGRTIIIDPDRRTVVPYRFQ